MWRNRESRNANKTNEIGLCEQVRVNQQTAAHSLWFLQWLFEPLLRSVKSGRTPQLKGEFRRHSLSGVRNERNNAALHNAEIAVPSHKAAEME